MTRIALVVSDVDGTLLTRDKILTDRAIQAVRQLHEAGIAFTITSSRPTIGMRFLVEPLQITLPIGPFNGSSIVDPALQPIEQDLVRESTKLGHLGIHFRSVCGSQWQFAARRGMPVACQHGMDACIRLASIIHRTILLCRRVKPRSKP